MLLDRFKVHSEANRLWEILSSLISCQSPLAPATRDSLSVLRVMKSLPPEALGAAFLAAWPPHPDCFSKLAPRLPSLSKLGCFKYYKNLLVIL